MKLRYYTDEELKILKSNIFVRSIKHKRQIEYDPIFKLWCVMMKLEMPELTGKEIFKRASFNTDILNDALPHKRIGEWLKNYKRFGINYFLPEDMPYHSKKKESSKYTEDVFKLKLLQSILQKLKEYENNEENR